MKYKTPITKADWNLISRALYYAARWEESVAESYTNSPDFREDKQRSISNVRNFEALRTRLCDEGRA